MFNHHDITRDAGGTGEMPRHTAARPGPDSITRIRKAKKTEKKLPRQSAVRARESRATLKKTLRQALLYPVHRPKRKRTAAGDIIIGGRNPPEEAGRHPADKGGSDISLIIC